MKFPLVMIEWLDASNHSANWHWLDDLAKSSPLKCHSVGWLISDKNGAKTLVAHISELEKEPKGLDDFRGTGDMIIPDDMIQNMWILKEVK